MTNIVYSQIRLADGRISEARDVQLTWWGCSMAIVCRKTALPYVDEARPRGENEWPASSMTPDSSQRLWVVSYRTCQGWRAVEGRRERGTQGAGMAQRMLRRPARSHAVACQRKQGRIVGGSK